MTPAELKAFQANPLHRDPFGRALKADGILGPSTQWALDLSTVAIGRVAILHRAWLHYGLVETGPNTDPEGLISGWLKAAGARPGDPWCASWASDAIGGRRIASALALGRSYPGIPPECVLPGDLVYFATDTKGHGHVELVLGRDTVARVIMTIGGNVANGVRLSLRPMGAVKCALVLSSAQGGTCPGVLHGHKDVLLRVPSFEGTR